MKEIFSFLKDKPARILFFIFIANIFYDDPTLYLYKRIVYSLCIYYAIYEILKFYYLTKADNHSFPLPFFYNVYIPLLILFIIIAVSMDVVNPLLKLTTLFNNPFALLSVTPILLFVIGANSDDMDSVIKVFFFAIITFVIVVALPIFGKVKYYQGYICCNAFIPFYIFANAFKKYRMLAYCLVPIGILFSQLSDYRIIALRILLFFSFYVALVLCKKFAFLKCLIIVVVCFCLYEFVANLQDVLYLFKSIIGVKDFDDDDTRGFLYEEVWGEMSNYDLLIGKGFVGTYFSQYFLMLITDYGQYADHFERFSVEVGFLELILKGGFFWYILYISPLLYTSMKGIFMHYNNNLVYVISIFLLTELLLMFIENIPYFSFQFSMLFFLAGYAIRRIKDDKETTNEKIAGEVESTLEHSTS